MSMHTWSLFLAVALAAVLTPGPAMLAILGHALERGARATFPVVLGNAAGAVLLIGASVAGVSALLAAAPAALTVLKVGGATWLGWLGLRALRRPPAAVEPRLDASGAGFGRGVLIALSNPKGLLFFGAVLPQFVVSTAPPLPQFAAMAGTFALLELSVTTAVTLSAQALAPRLGRRGGALQLQRAGGAVLLGAALILVLAPVRP